MAVTIQIPITTERYLQENAAREGMSLERYIAQLLTEKSLLSSKKKKKSTTEAELLQRIALDVQPSDLEEYHRLKALFQTGNITAEERENLIQLNDLIEIAHSKRMTFVVELAKLRRIPLEQLIADLGINSLSK